MKPLLNQQLFDGISACVYHNRNGCRYSTQEHHCFLRYLHPPELDPSLFLQCSLLCRSRSWTGDYHHRINPPFLTVTLIHSGEVAVRHKTEFFRAEAGDAILFHPNSDYEFMTETRCEKSAVILNGSALTALLKQGGLAEKTAIPLQAPERLEEYFSRLAVRLPESYRHTTRLEISGICCELLQFLAAPENIRKYPPPLERVLELMALRYVEPLNIGELANSAGISPAGLTRLFKRHLKTTPYKYLTEFRMRRAEQMLENHAFSIKEIAEKTGYCNPLNFSTEFRKRHSCSPREFMNGISHKPGRSARRDSTDTSET